MTDFIRYYLNRDVTKKECPWLDVDIIAKGTVVYLYIGYTYGCIGPGGTAVTMNGAEPFFELPHSALTKLGTR